MYQARLNDHVKIGPILRIRRNLRKHHLQSLRIDISSADIYIVDGSITNQTEEQVFEVGRVLPSWFSADAAQWIQEFPASSSIYDNPYSVVSQVYVEKIKWLKFRKTKRDRRKHPPRA